MKPSNPIVRIPQPCHEDWGKMKPEEKGRFCSSCEKVVVDFTSKSDQEIIDILQQRSGQKTCGHFRSTQVDSPLQSNTGTQNIRWHPLRIFAASLLLVFGSTLFSCRDQNDESLFIGNITVPAEQSEKSYSTLGEPTLLPPIVTEENTIPSSPAKTDTCFTEPMLMGDIIEVNYPDSTANENTNALEEDTLIVDPMTGGISYDPGPEPPDSSQESANTLNVRGHMGVTYFVDGVKVFVPTSEECPTTLPTNGLLIYPNPGTGIFNLNYTLCRDADVVIQVLDSRGRLILEPVHILQQHNGKYVIPADLSGQPAGLYIVRMIINDEIISQQVILQ